MRLTVLVAVVTGMCVVRGAAAGAQTPADPVATHRAAYGIIARDFPRYAHAEADMDSLGLERQSAEGGRLTAYCEGTAIRLLVAEYFGETGDATDRFYFERDALFFVLLESRRGRPDGSPYPPRTLVEHQRFYFTAGRLVRWLGPGNEAQSLATGAAREAEGELLRDAQRLRAAMPACRPKYNPL